MFSETDRENQELRNRIRWGDFPDEPNILYSYIDICKGVAGSGDKEFSKNTFFNLIDLLLETACDPCVPYHWRSLCLNNIYHPLYALSDLAENEYEIEKFRKKKHEIRLLTEYLFVSGEAS